MYQKVIKTEYEGRIFSEKQSKVKEYQHQINQMVYELYGLTEEEIKIVEQFIK